MISEVCSPDGAQMEKKNSPHIVLTKVSRPDTDHIVPRRRLYAKLKEETSVGAVWVQGEPGSGKTTLLASWITERATNAIWIQLDEADSDVATFFHYITLAIQRFHPEMELPSFTSEWQGAPLVFARSYFRKVFTFEGIPETWVLDDYHTLHESSLVHGVLAAGLAERPAHVRFALLSRGGPPPALSRLTVHGDIRVIQSADLSLTFGEASAIASTLGYRLELEQLEHMLYRADGWVAGFRLLLGAQHVPETYASHEQMLFNYFAEEVYRRMDENGRLVLVATSMASDFTESFATALTEISNAGDILNGLVERGCFLYRLHEDRNAFRYHPMFREYLSALAVKIFGSQLRSLMLRAAELLWNEGREETALEIACQVENWELVENYLLEIAPRLQQDGRLETIRATISHMPEDKHQQSPWMQYWLGLALFQSDAPAALKILFASFHAFDKSNDVHGRALAWSAISEFLIFSLDEISGLQYWLDRLEDILRDFETFPPDIQMNVAASVIDILAHFKPDHSGLQDWTEKAFELVNSGAARIEQRFHLARALVFYFGFWGNNQKLAIRLFDAMGDYAATVDPFNRLLWLMAESYAFFNAGDHERCIQSVTQGLAVSGESGFHHWDGVLMGIGAQCELRRGKADIANRYYKSMEAHVSSWRQQGVNGQRICEYFCHYVAAFLALGVKNFEKARQESELALGLAEGSGLSFLVSATHILRALGRGDELDRAELEQALKWGKQFRHVVVETCSYLALAYCGFWQGEQEFALSCLAIGLKQSRETEIINYVVGPSILSALCTIALDHEIEVEQASYILKKMNLSKCSSDWVVKSCRRKLVIHCKDGQVSISRQDKVLTETRKKPKKILELLQRLVDAGPRGCDLEMLADDLWKDTDGDRAVQSLHTTMHRLRKYLGDPSSVICANGRFFLNAQKVFVNNWSE